MCPSLVKNRSVTSEIRRRKERKKEKSTTAKQKPFSVLKLFRLKNMALWTLEARQVRADLIEVYKITHGLSSVSFSTFFEHSHNSTTSSSSSGRRQICKAHLHTKVSQTRLLSYIHSNSQLFRLRLNCSRVLAL